MDGLTLALVTFVVATLIVFLLVHAPLALAAIAAGVLVFAAVAR